MSLITSKILSAAGRKSPLPIEEVFRTHLYVGTGASQLIAEGIDLQTHGGLVWTKVRNSNTYSHVLTSSFNGWLDTRISNGDQASAYAGAGFTTSGFNTIAAFGDNTNWIGRKFVSWVFRRAPRFFDVVSYTGNGQSNRVINHNLRVKPGFIVIKAINSGGGDWYTFARIEDGKYVQSMRLNATSSSGSSIVNENTLISLTNSTFAPNDVFSWTATNATGTPYVAYLFAHDPLGPSNDGSDSLIQCGGYVGNATTTEIEVEVGFEPQWLLIKSISSDSNWVILDTERAIAEDGGDFALYTNSNSSESRLSLVDIRTNGFSIKSSSVDVNAAPSYTTTATIVASSTRGPQVQDSVKQTTSISPCYIFGTHVAGEWISYDLGFEGTANQVTYRNTPSSSHAPTSVKIQTSTDNINWNDVTTYADNGSLTLQTITFSNTTSRYWRIFQNSNTRGNSNGNEWHFNNVRIRLNGTEVMPLNAEKNMIYMAIRKPDSQNEQLYTVAGNYSWTAPQGVTSVSVVAVGGGGGAGYTAGGGGGLVWANNISVTPGNSYSIVVGNNGGNFGAGGNSTAFGLIAYGGGGGSSSSSGAGRIAAGGTYFTNGYADAGGGNGGYGGDPSDTNNWQGGGGAGGYTGNGGNGGTSSSPIGVSGSGGGGGGGYYGDNSGRGGAGGVGLYGLKENGVGGSSTTSHATGGSGGGGARPNGSLQYINGGNFGGGGAWTGGSQGGSGAVRIIWPGNERQFPSTNVGVIYIE